MTAECSTSRPLDCQCRRLYRSTNNTIARFSVVSLTASTLLMLLACSRARNSGSRSSLGAGAPRRAPDRPRQKTWDLSASSHCHGHVASHVDPPLKNLLAKLRTLLDPTLVPARISVSLCPHDMARQDSKGTKLVDSAPVSYTHLTLPTIPLV